MRIELVQIVDIKDHPSNVNTHPVRNLDVIKGSLQRFGQRVPLVLDAEGTCLAGMGRLRSMRELGWTHAKVVRASLEGMEQIAFMIADNRTSELSEWDQKPLAAILKKLNDEDYPIDVAGWSQSEFEALFKEKSSPAGWDALHEPSPDEKATAGTRYGEYHEKIVLAVEPEIAEEVNAAIQDMIANRRWQSKLVASGVTCSRCGKEMHVEQVGPLDAEN